jgi:hypothetical protein
MLAYDVFETHFRKDAQSLREIFGDLNRLEAAMENERATIGARRRGFFTPEEDNRIRQLLVAYRDHRRALYEILERYMDYEDLGDVPDQLRGFIVAYSIALTLYAKALKVIQTYEHEPLVRNKLNEPDAKFGIERGFFEEILRAHTSLWNYRRLLQGDHFWRRQRRIAQQMRIGEDPTLGWLCDVIRRQRSVVKKRFWGVLARRSRHDWLAGWALLTTPVRLARYRMQALLFGLLGHLRMSFHYEPAIDSTACAQLKAAVQTGDILLVRSERKLTSLLLPGFWTHAAIFIGGCQELEQLGVSLHPHVRKNWENIRAAGGPHGVVLEAISRGVVISTLQQCLCVDHVAVLRPNISGSDLEAAVIEAFGHVGKPYDFQFDFNVTTRIVCTELVYRSYHRGGQIEFPLIKRLGRFTLSADDIMNWFLNSVDNVPDRQNGPFRLVSLLLQAADGKPYLIPIPEAIQTLGAIREGLRPSAALAPKKG